MLGLIFAWSWHIVGIIRIIGIHRNGIICEKFIILVRRSILRRVIGGHEITWLIIPYL